MTTIATTLLTNSIDSIGLSQSIASSATTINMGNPAGSVNISNLIVTTVKPKINVLTLQINTFTVDSILAGGSTIVSTYTSANPSTANDSITINLPTPDSRLDGIQFFFRKMRGALNNSSENWRFVTNPSSIIVSSATASTTGHPIAAIGVIALFVRMTVLGINGTYYWCIL